MNLEFSGTIWYWRGPAPWYFVTIPPGPGGNLKTISGLVTYGWGCIPVHVKIGRTVYYTALFPKDGSYIVPIKAAVRRAENLDEGDEVTIRLEVNL